MAGFYNDPWAAQSNTLLTGNTTYNGMGATGASSAPPAASGGSVAGFGYVSIASSVIGMIGGAMLARTQAKAQKSGLEFQSEMSKINGRMAEMSAQSMLYQGQQQIASLTLRAGKIKSGQRVAMAANGIDLGEGNAVEVQATTDLMTEVDKNTIEANALRSAWGYRTQGVNANSQALISKASADSSNPNAAAASTLMGGAGDVAKTWYAMNKTGAFN